MADLFDKPRRRPSAPKPTTANPGSERKANSGVISDKAAAELKATVAEAAEKMKAGAGKLADQAGEFASKAKSTWVPAVKARIHGIEVPRIPGKTLVLGAGVLLAAIIGTYAWHMHSTAPIAAAPKPAPATAATVTKAPQVEASIPASIPVPKLVPVVEAPKTTTPQVANLPSKPVVIAPPPVVVPKPPVAPAPTVAPPVVAQAKSVMAKPAPKPRPAAQSEAEDKMLKDDSAKLDAYFKQH